ncbi:hypothetical protein F5878DRAFT_620217 [Lentinula raphanica]|uniref:Uncharacterized protein n=1 Tax=Lentinula raphanica TaxID=153919 RepID=A0AA38P8B8_9AGAR|nr:hypothetical protein C8R42DRAFT_727499 [Lentinula raphanica]KAJ3838188.1 hypothetical protein F5878DRAFT_620217 [Lentinula raphanica]
MADATLPPFDLMFMTGIWIETVLYGVNTIVFATAIIILTRMYRTGKSSAGFLLVTSVFLFLLSTTYVSICLRQLLEAFIWGPSGEASLYFLNIPDRLSITKLALYEVNVFTQDMILIWRMWVVYNKRIIVVILPIAMEFGHVAAGVYSISRGASPHVSVFDPLVHRAAIAYWTLDLAVNIGVTFCIAYKLWAAGRSLERVGLGRNKHPYTGIIFTIVESGGIFATATLVTVSLYLSGNFFPSVAAIDSVVQLATTTPLLIVVRIGLGLQHGIPANSTMTTSTIWFANSDLASMPRPQGLRVNIAESRNIGDDTAAVALQQLESDTISVRNKPVDSV